VVVKFAYWVLCCIRERIDEFLTPLYFYNYSWRYFRKGKMITFECFPFRHWICYRGHSNELICKVSELRELFSSFAFFRSNMTGYPMSHYISIYGEIISHEVLLQSVSQSMICNKKNRKSPTFASAKKNLHPDSRTEHTLCTFTHKRKRIGN
jgi:hypothetical protein